MFNWNNAAKESMRASKIERLRSPELINPAESRRAGGGGDIKFVKTQANAGAALYISCKFCDQNGTVSGDAFNVYGVVIGGGYLNAASPRIYANDYPLMVQFIEDKWWFVFPFTASVNCTCGT